ncbi:MAG: glycosyltransferase [Lentisphaerae bacterium]|nr:glycosyltransferase [Lentisphaerota bacterium]
MGRPFRAQGIALVKISVILPAFNLSKKIGANLERVESVLKRTGLTYEIVPVDDGSSDGTSSSLLEWAQTGNADIRRPVILERNVGKGGALRAGFRTIRGELVLLLDGDLEILPGYLPGFLEVMEREGADIVIGSKRHPKSRVMYPWHRRLASSVYFALVRFFIGMPVTDTQTGMKLFRREILGDALDRMLVKTYAFDLELLSIAYGRGAKISEAPVAIKFGEGFGALSFRTVRQMFMDSLAVFYRLRLLNYYAYVEVPPPLDHNPFISVVIACPNGSWMLDECLEALRLQTYREFEVIVLPDGNLDISEDYGYPLKVIPTGKVRPAEKRNIGIERSRGEVVAFIDDDAYPDSRWLENAVKYFGEPTIGALGGPGVTPPGDGFWAKCGGRVYENIFVSGNYRYRYLGGRARRDIDDYPSCNLFVRKEVLDLIGGYRTDFWPGEDTLLCEDIVCRAKKRIVYDPWTLVYHHRRPLFAAHLRQLGRYGFHRGYFVKRFPVTSCRFSYFVPTLFVLYLLALAAIFLFRDFIGGGDFGPKAAVVASPLMFYAVLTAFTTVSLNPFKWLVTELGVFLSHVWYGVQFLRGLLAHKAPCEFIGKDHA